MSQLVYHGAACSVKEPLATYGCPDLDFGQGFYVTPLRGQAERWAQIVGLRSSQGEPCLNIYELDLEYVRQNYRCRCFEAYDQVWLDFIVQSRQGLKPWFQMCLLNQHLIDKCLHFKQCITLSLMPKGGAG